MSDNKFKTELETILKIIEWDQEPTDTQLSEIAQKISELEASPSTSDIAQIALSIGGSYKCMLLEGVDNTDLSTLLALAIQATKDRS